MSLMLDPRQRAMLREIGVRVWQPMQVAAEPVAPDFIAAPAHADWARGTFSLKDAADAATTTTPVTTAAPPLRAAAAIPRARAPAPVASASASPGLGVGWLLGDAQTLHIGAATAPTAPAEAAGPRWLLLAETPAASLRAESFDPLAGDAGKLLANMLRAARLDRSENAIHPSPAGAVLLAPLARLDAGGAATDSIGDALAGLIERTRPDIMLVMGRLAAQALLQSSEPLGKLRGRVHRLHGVRAVITYDAVYLLRSPLEKAKAWEDLCLAVGESGRPA